MTSGELAVLFVVGFLGFLLLIVLIAAVLLISRNSSLEKRIAALEGAMMGMERRLRADGGARAEAPPGAATQPASSPPPPRPLSPVHAPGPPPRIAPSAGTAPHSPPTPPPRPSHGPSATGGTVSPIDWERWVGIRGAAVLGGIVLALAGILLFQYSIQHGLITPIMRVAIGILVGLGCLVASEWLESRGYRYTPEATAGAGIVVLYASFWAAYSLYALIGLSVAFVLMALATVACCLLSVRHASQIIAVLGLVGGFATPLVLRSEVDRPLGLFGYTLLLDLGLIAMGRSKRWPPLGILSVLGTLVLQIAWIGARMTPDRFGLALGILGVFAVLFAISGEPAISGEARRGDGDATASKVWLASQACGVLLPFTFAIYFAFRTDLGPHLYPLALLMGLLVVAAGWIDRRSPGAMLGVMAACGAVGVTGVWMTQRPLTAALGWEAVAVAAGLTVILHLFVELAPLEVRVDGPGTGVVLAAAGFFLVSVGTAGAAGVAGAAGDSGLWPWLALWLILWGILLRVASLQGRAPVALLGAVGTGLGLAVFGLSHGGSAVFPGWGAILLVAMSISALACALSRVLREDRLRAFTARGAALVAAIVLFSLALSPRLHDLDPLTALGGALVLGVLAGAPSVFVSEGAWFALAGALTLLVHTIWTSDRLDLLRGISPQLDEAIGTAIPSAVSTSPASLAAQASLGRTAFFVALLGALLFTAGPFLTRRRLQSDRMAWIFAALAMPLWFPVLRRLFVASFGNEAIGGLPLGLATLAAGAAWLSWRTRPEGDPLRRTILVAFSATAFGLATIAVPLQLSDEWLTIGWAVEGLLAIALWRRLDHPGLKYGGLSLLAAAGARLLLNTEVLSYHPRSDVRILNWLALTYLVPAGAMLLSAALLRGREAARAASWESDVYRKGHHIGAVAATLGAIMVVFAWLNLTVLDWFATGPRLTLHLAHVPACDLTLSMVWAMYALVLLGFGMAWGSEALRWVSLSFLVLTIGKVFLYDLGQLEDLYRVASLVALAISLLLVSLLYQRFVFRKTPGDGSGGG